MKKKMLLVSDSLGGGGTEVALVEFINHLDEKKYDVSVLLLNNDFEFKDRLKRKVRFILPKYKNKIWYNLTSTYAFVGKAIKKINLNKYIDFYSMALKNIKLNIDSYYDIAIDFYGYGSITTAIVAKGVNAYKKAMWIHDEKMPWMDNSKRYFGYYNKIFCVSKSIKEAFDKHFPEEKGKSEVMYNMIDANTIIQKSNKFYPKEFKNEKLNIVTVGRLTEQKGYDISILAAAYLKKDKIPFDWYAIGDGRDKKKLLKLVSEHNLNNQFHFLGKKNNPYPYVKNCDVFVLPSRHEGYSIAILEARILKKIVITSDFPANKEQIVDKQNGLISKMNPYDLSNCIEKIYNDKKLAKKILQYLNTEEIDFGDQLAKLDYL